MGVEAASISVQVVGGSMAGGLESSVSVMPTVGFGPATEMLGNLPAEFMPGGSYSPENMPLADSIPLNRNPDPGKKDTAAHEIQHAIVGLAKGNSLVAISVNPEGTRLGWTLFSGEVDPPTVAAGSINTVFGPASGFGGDLATIMFLDLKHGRDPGSSIFSAQNEAQSIISRFDSDFLAIASEIIALKGFLTAQDFEEVLRRAEFEMAWRNCGFDLKDALSMQGLDFAKDYKDDQSENSRMVIPDSGTFTLIETYEDKIVTTVITDGIYGIPKVVCPRCGVEGGGHLPSCEAVKVKGITSMPIPAFESPITASIIDQGEIPTDSTELPDFPQDAVIFSG